MKAIQQPALVAAIVFVLSFDIAWLWQQQSGAFQSELGGHPREAAHYLAGVRYHDYAAHGFPADPVGHAELVHRHYPGIALDAASRGLALVQSAWIGVFGAKKRATLLLLAAVAAGLAVQVYRSLREEYGQLLAALGGLLLLFLPLVIEHYHTFRPELLAAWLILAAALVWSRFLERERTLDPLLFSLLAGLAVITTPTALALAMQAPLALAFARRWHLLKRPALWAAAFLFAAIAGPMMWALGELQPGSAGHLAPRFSWEFVRPAARYYLGTLGIQLGPVLLLLCVAGIFHKLRHPGSRPALWASSGALLLSVLCVPIIVPADLDPGHLLPAFAPAAMFVVAGLDRLLRFARTRRKPDQPPLHLTELATGAMILGVGLWVTHRLAPPDPKRWSGFQPIASALVNDAALNGAEILIASDARGEGMLVSELVMLEKRPSHVIRSASRDLAVVDREGRPVRLKYASDDELLEWFEQEGAGVRAVVVDDSIPEASRGPHHDQLIRLCEQQTQRFWLVSTSPIVRGGEPHPTSIRLYQVRPPAK